MEEQNKSSELLLQGKKRALRLLERKDYSRKELSERLKKDGYELEIIEKILEYADRFHYLDDTRVAENYIRSHKGYKSRRELDYLLRQKGISEEEIDLALEENYIKEDGTSQEEDVIRKQLIKYHLTEETLQTMSYEEKQKYAARLFRKGFEPDKIKKQLGM